MALVCMIVLQEEGEEHCPAAFISIMTTFFLCKIMLNHLFCFFFAIFFVLSMLVHVQLFAFVLFLSGIFIIHYFFVVL